MIFFDIDYHILVRYWASAQYILTTNPKIIIENFLF
jgi:hypothetical protein